MKTASPVLRPGKVADLEASNAVIEAAVMRWDLPERVKRLSLPAYRYQVHDVEHLDLWVAEQPARGIVGVAAWEPAAAVDAPDGKRGLLLHGIYVAPDLQRTGIGLRLIGAAADAARAGGFDGVLVKAQSSATGFFLARGFEPLPVMDPARDYPHRYWLQM